MLKYQVRAASRPDLRSSGSTSSGVSLASRSPSVSSLSSLDSADNDNGVLKIYTWNVSAFTDYKALRVHTSTTVADVIDSLVNKLKLTARDPNLFEMFMEVTTRHEGRPVRNLLLLHPQCRPLEMSRCHPVDMSRFIVHLKKGGELVRVHDHHLEAQSNYKSLMLAPETSTDAVTRLVLAMNRREKEAAAGTWGLFVEVRRQFMPNSAQAVDNRSAQIPPEAPLVPIYKLLSPQHKITIRRV